MVVSLNPEPNRFEFEVLLRETVNTLKFRSRLNVDMYCNLLGNKLEKEVADTLTFNAKGTPFEGSIELISGQKFPDIIANKFYGVEVKTTKSNHWKSTGSSVAEGTRVEGIERIFMLFGKMCEPIDFMCKPYEDCLSEVVVTHSPRYLIDMNLGKGETIFDKINVSYDDLRKQTNPIETVLNYYKGKLKPGESTWWSGQRENIIANNMIIRLWNNLDVSERNYYLIKGFCLFPELFSNRTDKFNRFALWLSTREGVVCPNVRDIFTAGGQGKVNFHGKEYFSIPRILIKMIDNLFSIKEMLFTLDLEDFQEYWGCYVPNLLIYDKWRYLVISEANKNGNINFPLDQYLKEM